MISGVTFLLVRLVIFFSFLTIILVQFSVVFSEMFIPFCSTSLFVCLAVPNDKILQDLQDALNLAKRLEVEAEEWFDSVLEKHYASDEANIEAFERGEALLSVDEEKLKVLKLELKISEYLSSDVPKPAEFLKNEIAELEHKIEQLTAQLQERKVLIPDKFVCLRLEREASERQKWREALASTLQRNALSKLKAAELKDILNKTAQQLKEQKNNPYIRYR